MVYYACPYGNRKPQEILNMFASYQISIDAVIMDLSPSPKQKDGILSSLKKRLVNEHDGLTVDSLRSLGKTNREIAKELQWIEMNNIPFFVLDLPSTFNDKAKPIEVLSETYTKLAEFEVQKIREGQAKSNKPSGRSRIPYPPNWDFVYNKWLNKEITIPEFMKLTGLKRGTLYNLLKQSKRQESEANSLKNSNNHSA